MDKESFPHIVIQPESQGHEPRSTVATVEEFVNNLPVPSKLPSPPDFSHLPAEILRSSTVETLIHQNEDLLSRLSISLRRNSTLEETVSQLEKKNRILVHKFTNIEDQLFVYKKKDELIEGKYGKYEEKISELKKDLKFFETQYTELYSTSQSHISDLKSKIAQFSKRISRFSRFKKRATQIYRNLQQNLKVIEEENHRLLAEVASLTETHKALKMNMASAVSRLQQVEKENKSTLADLTSNYEDQLENKNKVLHQNQQDISELSSELEKAKQVYETNIDLENKVVHLDRKIIEQKQVFQDEISGLQTELQENRHLVKKKILEVESLEEQNFEYKISKDELTQHNQKLLDQVESLQSLWRNNNEQLESMKQKYSSLQKLNQQISITLNDTRKLLQTERDQKETITFRTKDKISQLESQIHLLSTQTIGVDSNGTVLKKIQPKVIDHIQSLIAEVQSGVDSTPIEDSKSFTSSLDAES